MRYRILSTDPRAKSYGPPRTTAACTFRCGHTTPCSGPVFPVLTSDCGTYYRGYAACTEHMPAHSPSVPLTYEELSLL